MRPMKVIDFMTGGWGYTGIVDKYQIELRCSVYTAEPSPVSYTHLTLPTILLV